MENVEMLEWNNLGGSMLMRVGLKMGFITVFIVIAFWMWVVKKIQDIDERTKEISNVLTEISNRLNSIE